MTSHRSPSGIAFAAAMLAGLSTGQPVAEAGPTTLIAGGYQVTDLYAADAGVATARSFATPSPAAAPGAVSISADGMRVSNAHGFTIAISAGRGLADNPEALASFDRAAARWVDRITSPITLTVSADLTYMGSSSILSQTSTFMLHDAYDGVRGAMVAHGALRGPQDAILSALPTYAQFHAVMPAGASLDGDMLATKANFKALGYGGLDAAYNASDAGITFNRGFNFAYDNRMGLQPGQYDFESIASHEIGHAMGFLSAVDNVDYLKANPGSVFPIEPFPLDLFRFETGKVPANAAEFTAFARLLDTGGDASTADTVSQYRLSTGQATGDGNQAGHWKSTAQNDGYIGIMIPNFSPGAASYQTDADFRAMELMGYDTTPAAALPEPSGIILMALGVAGVVGYGWLGRRAGRRPISQGRRPWRGAST